MSWQARSLSLDLLLDWRQCWVVSREVLVVRLGLFQVLPEFQFCLGPASGPGRLPRDTLGPWQFSLSQWSLGRYLHWPEGLRRTGCRD